MEIKCLINFTLKRKFIRLNWKYRKNQIIYWQVIIFIFSEVNE